MARRGVRAVLFDSDHRQPGFRSVHGPARLCPDPGFESEAWLRFMLELAGEFREAAALIPSSDQYVTAIARHAEALEGHYILSPGISLQGMLAEKRAQYEIAANHGMPMPRTRCVSSVESVVEFARDATFPCLVKPRHLREWNELRRENPLLVGKVLVARSEQSLVEKYRLASTANPTVILQEVIEGSDLEKRVYLSCYDAESRRIAHAMFRELRCNPMGFGPASVSEPVADPETDEICDRFLREIGYSGVCEIEMKRDRRDGRVKLIEVNPRLSGGGDAAPYAGVDLCWLHYLDLIGQVVTPVAPSGKDFRHVVLRADGSAIPAYWRANRLSWRDILRSYRRPLAFFDLDPRDWRYSAETLLVAARSFVRGFTSGFFRRRRSP